MREQKKTLSKIEIPITTIREIFLCLNSFAVNVNVKYVQEKFDFLNDTKMRILH